VVAFLDVFDDLIHDAREELSRAELDALLDRIVVHLGAAWARHVADDGGDA
jgi:hypothetical protein